MREITSKDLKDIRDNFPLDACLLPPDLSITPEAAQAFDRLYDAAVEQGPGAKIDYTLPYPKYLFLEHLAAARGVLFHGSNNRAIDVLRPIRFTTDSSEFGNQAAIYATQDPLWAMFFAVLDKTGLLGTSNGAIQVVDQSGALIRRYYFTLEANNLRNKPGTPGAMYILPGEGFEPDPQMVGTTAGPYTVQVTHWIYRGERTPTARLDVEPQDFPYLDQIWGFDAEAYSRRLSEEFIGGFPFLDDPEVYPILPQRPETPGD